MRIIRRHSISAAVVRRAVGATVLLVAGALGNASLATPIFINEIHYDNSGSDTGEAVEIAGPVGTALAGWSLVLYNGNGGAVYDTEALDGIFMDQQNGFGTLLFSIPGIQNGGPDGLALIDSDDNVVQFLSYEGAFVAVGGPANGMTSIDIGVSESSSTLAGHSLQLTGTGNLHSDFTWAEAFPSTFGGVNNRQTFQSATEEASLSGLGTTSLQAPATPMPEPATVALIGVGLVGMRLTRRQQLKH